MEIPNCVPDVWVPRVPRVRRSVNLGNPVRFKLGVYRFLRDVRHDARQVIIEHRIRFEENLIGGSFRETVKF